MSPPPTLLITMHLITVRWQCCEAVQQLQLRTMVQHFVWLGCSKLLCRCQHWLPSQWASVAWRPHSSHLHAVLRQQVACMSVWERDKKAGYRKPINLPKTKMIKDGVKMIGSEMGMWCEEMKEKFTADQNVFDIQHEDYEYVWKFHERQSVEEWLVTSDRDNSEGFSEGNFTFSRNNTALFHGHLSQQVPKDGVVKRTGYCNIRSPTKFVSPWPTVSMGWLESVHYIIYRESCQGHWLL